MPSLSETLAGLAEARTPLARADGDHGLTESLRFGPNPGALRMLSYIPAGLKPGAPLVVVLHGCTQRAGAFAAASGWITLADRHGFALLSPEQTGANNPNRCFNWFERADAKRGSGEAASIHAMVEHMVRRHALERGQIYVTGLSAGGAMTAALLAAYPETFAGGAVIAGLPFGQASGMQQAFALMRQATKLSSTDLKASVLAAAPAPSRWPRLTIWHGEADSTVVSSNALALARQWSAVHGLCASPDAVEARGRWTRSIWRGPDGEALIECNLVAGLGHGSPLAATGPRGLGHTAPYMLEAGISSTLEIARFWGLAPVGAPDQELMTAGPALEERCGLGERILSSVAGHVSADVRAVIDQALRTAGLMGRR